MGAVFLSSLDISYRVVASTRRRLRGPEKAHYTAVFTHNRDDIKAYREK